MSISLDGFIAGPNGEAAWMLRLSFALFPRIVETITTIQDRLDELGKVDLITGARKRAHQGLADEVSGFNTQFFWMVLEVFLNDQTSLIDRQPVRWRAIYHSFFFTQNSTDHHSVHKTAYIRYAGYVAHVSPFLRTFLIEFCSTESARNCCWEH